jgi:hypothetical protein
MGSVAVRLSLRANGSARIHSARTRNSRHRPRMRAIQYSLTSAIESKGRGYVPGLNISRMMTTEGVAGCEFNKHCKHTFTFSRRAAPEVCQKSPALFKMRAQGMPGARCAHGPVCMSSGRCAHERTGHTGITRHSPRNGLRLIRALPGDRAFLPPSSALL